MNKWLVFFKKKWKVTSTFQFFVIMIVFAITGSLSIYISKPILSFFNINQNSLNIMYYPIRILIIFPIYQILIVLIGALFGQFSFFWNLEKKMLMRISSLFIGKKEDNH
tara:strand:- start:6 stop:332 length:327 start_codon:yes stop_codon:yes gene_type:complete